MMICLLFHINLQTFLIELYDMINRGHHKAPAQLEVATDKIKNCVSIESRYFHCVTRSKCGRWRSIWKANFISAIHAKHCMLEG
jgi:hypothetical protein